MPPKSRYPRRSAPAVAVAKGEAPLDGVWRNVKAIWVKVNALEEFRLKYLQEENDAMRKKLGVKGKRSAPEEDLEMDVEDASSGSSTPSDAYTTSPGTSSDEDVDEYIDYGKLAVHK